MWFDCEWKEVAPDKEGNVLQAPRDGVAFLVSELQRIQQHTDAGPHRIDYPSEVLRNSCTPFEFVELLEHQPPEEEAEPESKWWWLVEKGFWVVLLGVPLLALYGLVSLVLDAVGWLT